MQSLGPGGQAATFWAVTEQLMPAPLLLMDQFSADAAAGALCTLTSARSSIKITTGEQRARECAMIAALLVHKCAAAVGERCGTDRGPANRNREPAEDNNGDGRVSWMLGGWRWLCCLQGDGARENRALRLPGLCVFES